MEAPLEDDFPEEFQCCICLDLLYKPVVAACGHMACFWCILKTMEFCQGCAVCRTPSNYFPRPCRLLHSMLRKSYPSAYARRGKEVSEEENEYGIVSQQFDDYKYEGSDSVSSELPSDSQQSVMTELTENHMTTKIISETVRDDCMQQNGQASNKLQDGPNVEVVTSDLTCAICKQLLCRPVVLNCGDVYCEACIFNSSDTICKCPVCQSPHPNGFPNVCWVLEHFLERQFPQEYADRRESVLEHPRPSKGSNKPDPNPTAADALASWFSGEGPPVHSAGCDYCGMHPIIGKRYRCKDCKEKMGFDLCEGCYNSSSKLPGRFNQQHTEDHQFEIVEISMDDAMDDAFPMIAAGLVLDQGLELEQESSSNNISSSDDESEQTLSNIHGPEEGTDSRTNE